MPALGVYQRVVITGTSVGSEIWQTGFYIADTAPPATQADLQSLLNSIGTALDTWWTAVKAHCYTSFAYTGASMYQYVAPSTSAQFQARRDVTPVAGTLASAGSPIDSCCVVSLRSSVPGRRGRNRMYVPFMDGVPTPGACWSATQTGLIGTATKALMTAVSGSSAAVPIVVSRTGNVYNPLASLVTDNKPDVQRRRENKVLPTGTQVLAYP